MDGIDFITVTPPVAIDPARADVACFVGFVARRPVRPRAPGESDANFLGRLPVALRNWFRQSGWTPGRHGRTVEDLVDLLDVPVPIDTWEAFDQLFAWEIRPIDATPSSPRCDTALGAAVHSFFAQGGRLCYVIRMGDPWAVRAPAEQRRAFAFLYLPHLPPASPADRSTWRGVAHLFGLPGVSFLCVPDLPEIFGVAPPRRDPRAQPEGPEVFVECAVRVAPQSERFLRGVPAPRCDADGFRAWAACVRGLGEFVVRHKLIEVQVLAAIPLPVDTATLAGEAGAAARVHRANSVQWEQVATIHTAFVQLVYPWLRTRESSVLPGNVLPPDGLFAGLLANGALTRGSWSSLIRQLVAGISAIEPVLDRATLGRELLLAGAGPAAARAPVSVSVRDHVSVIGPTPGGFRVLSDVTTDDDETYRPGSVNRLVVAIVRAARIVGEDVVFANNGEALWRRLRESIEGLLTGLWAEGALLGSTADQAFEVRCDRSTMTQADIDAGRLFARVIFTASQPIVRITVMLAMDDAGQVTLVARGAAPPYGANSQAA